MIKTFNLFTSRRLFRSFSSRGILGVHDVGGDDQLIKSALPKYASDCDSPAEHWEKKIHATLGILCNKGLMSVDEMRRGIEQLPEQSYVNWSYYEKWAASMLQICLERELLTNDDIAKHITGDNVEQPTEAFPVGATVKVSPEDMVTRWRKPHLRTPGYIFENVGVVERVVGKFNNPELLAYRVPGVAQYLYRVRFNQKDVWEQYEGGNKDTIDVEIFQPWLTLVSNTAVPDLKGEHFTEQDVIRNINQSSKETHPHHEHHDHEHHDHVHESREKIELNAVEKEGEETPGHRLSNGFVKILLENNVISQDELRTAIEGFDMMGSKKEAAQIVARAWVDDAFRERLLIDGNSAAGELGIVASNSHTSTKLVVVENTDDIHNLVVCTLCSCYPVALLGPSPSWYKTRSYRARAVRQPRKLLKEEFGLEIPESTTVRVHDSTADCRYFVLPKRPRNTEALSESELVELISRDSMIGVAVLPDQV